MIAAPRLARRTAPILVVVAGLAGCMVGPDYVQPEAPLAETWIDAPTAATEAAVDPRWWKQFNDPALDALIEESLSQNLTLRAAGLRVIQARAVRGITVGEFFPQTQEAFGSIGRSANSENGPLSQGDRFYSDATLGLQAAWELDFWGRFRRAIESSDAALLATVADYDTTLISLVADVATSYVQLRSFEERLTLARDNVRLQRDTVELTDVRLRAGAVSELDVATARALLSSTESLIPELEDGRRRSLISLGVLLGRPPSELSEFLGEAAAVPTPPPEIAVGVPAELLRRRPDVRTAERVAAAASAQIGVATADLFPSISITGATGFASSDIEFGGQTSDLGDIFKPESFQGFIGLTVNWPILNYGRIENNIRARDAEFQRAITQYQETVLRAAGDVETGLSNFLKSRARAAHLDDAVTSQMRAVEISLIQYRNGAIDFIRVNQAQTDLVQRQDESAVARADTATGAIATFLALGGGWEVRAGSEFIDAETARQMRERTDWGDLLAPDYSEGSDLLFDRPDDTTAQP